MLSRLGLDLWEQIASTLGTVIALPVVADDIFGGTKAMECADRLLGSWKDTQAEGLDHAK